MKRFVVFCTILLTHYTLVAQDKKPVDYTGQYQVDYYPSRKMNVFRENNNLILEIVGQGKIGLIPLSENTFSAKQIPNLKIIFIQDSLGNTTKFKWIRQQPPYELIKTSDPGGRSLSDSSGNNMAIYEGRYSVKGSVYISIQVKADSGRLIVGIPGETSLLYYPVDKNIFIFKNGEFSSVYEFLSDRKGHINRIKTTETGPFECIKISSGTTNMASAKHSFAKRIRFTAADSLQGSLSPLRSCYDVLFYRLDIKVNPDTKFIQGSTVIRFKSLLDFSLCQIDLFANMKIEKIIFQGADLSYTRKFDAVFVQFPLTIKQGAVEEIEIFYSGNPQVLIPNLAGGFIWMRDRNGKPWIETVCQGSGASLWWPCKDHLSDKPDSMHVSVTVPEGLTAVSNGRFLGKTDLPDKEVKFQWAVSYPINTYDAVLYIGDYVHFSDQYAEGTDHFPLNYYCLSYNLDKARQFVQKVKPLLAFYQKAFGPYPFPLDGYALVESPYGMEHQSAVSIGAFSNPLNDKPMDPPEEMERMLFHESAHEWWGNSVTCSDYADFWIHESFASYAEVLSYENFYGPDAAGKYLLKQVPENKEPIIGFYGVNDFHEGDMYPKGARMISSLRTAINNDSLFFSLLKGIQSHFKYQTVTTSDIVNYINQGTGTDYTYLFDQYLRHAAIPKLLIGLKKSGNDLEVRYKWKADVPDFRLPVKVSTETKEPFLIYPTSEWKTIQMTNSKPRDFHVDNISSYFELETE